MTKTVFVLEDNQDLLNDIKEEARRIGWEVRAARCVEEASELAEKVGREMHAALIDLMVPMTRTALSTLDELLQKRMDFVLKRTNKGRSLNLSADELVAARQELTAIDAKIQECVEPEGGRLFLAEATKAKLSAYWEIVVFSARDKTKDGLDTRMEASLPPGKEIVWLHKPVPPDELTRLLQRLANA